MITFASRREVISTPSCSFIKVGFSIRIAVTFHDINKRFYHSVICRVIATQIHGEDSQYWRVGRPLS